MKQIIQVVPTLPPEINGVGDYALSLSLQLRQDFDVETQFIIGNPDWPGFELLNDFNVLKVKQRSLNALLTGLEKASNSNIILLHYVGYGYARRGCPTWLVDSLTRWKAANGSGGRIITMFHEVASSGPLWTSAYWTSPLQRKLVMQLLQISNSVITSKKLYADLLSRYSDSRFTDIPSISVFSNVGEPIETLPLTARQRHLVIFGGIGQRTRLYGNSVEEIIWACKYFDIGKILDIGPRFDLSVPLLDQYPVEHTGSLAPSAISALLSHSVAGFLNYDPEFLGKSGVFAAFCAHGVVPINVRSSDASDDGLIPGVHYVAPTRHMLGKHNLDLMQTIAQNAYHWYQSHNLSAHASFYYSQLYQ